MLHDHAEIPEDTITTVFHSDAMSVARAKSDGTLFYTVTLPDPVKAESLALAREYLPGWILLDSVEERDGRWFFHFSAVA